MKKSIQVSKGGGSSQYIVVVSPDLLKQEIFGKFSPVYQHDCHEFFTYVMSTLQDEETPTVSHQSTDTSNQSAEIAWATYESSHPSIIDKLFSGTLHSLIHAYRYAKNNRNL